MSGITNGMNGRTPTRQMRGVHSNGTSQKQNTDKYRADFATEDDFAEIRALITTEEGRQVLDRKTRNRNYYTRLELEELRVGCNAEGLAIVVGREVTKLVIAGLPVPIMITSRQIRIGDGKEDPYGDTIQAYGCGGLEKRYNEEARLSRNALGENKQAQTKIIAEVTQMMLPGFGGEAPEDMTDDELDAALAEEVGNVVSILKAGKTGR